MASSFKIDKNAFILCFCRDLKLLIIGRDHLITLVIDIMQWKLIDTVRDPDLFPFRDPAFDEGIIPLSDKTPVIINC